MFKEIQYSSFKHAKSYNVYHLQDTCFSEYIISPYNSPSLKNVPNAIANTLTMLSIAKFYETRNRNIPLNLAYYYYWLNEQGYYIDQTFVKKQLQMIDLVMPQLNFKKKYFHSICQYLESRNLLRV